ncbi:MAG TPA: DUF4349 domain-containing protein [Gemmatimonadaceae bacterium]|nr:DUF4349 domain-containing protein [Gemmatimonadaceae bacterium]
MILSPTEQVEQRVLIRTATQELSVQDVASVHARAIAIVTALGGRVDRDVLEDRSSRTLLRVPNAQLEAALDSIATLGTMTHRTISVQDLTTTAIDLDARIASLIAMRDRLRQLHDQAANLAQVLELEREIARVQGEIDSLQGQRNHLREAAALSELDLTIKRKVVLGPVAAIGRGIGHVLGKLFIWR